MSQKIRKLLMVLLGCSVVFAAGIISVQAAENPTVLTPYIGEVRLEQNTGAYETSPPEVTYSGGAPVVVLKDDETLVAVGTEGDEEITGISFEYSDSMTTFDSGYTLPADVGTYYVRITLQQSGTQPSYQLYGGSAAAEPNTTYHFKIVPRDVTITADPDQTFVYDGQAHEPQYKITGAEGIPGAPTVDDIKRTFYSVDAQNDVQLTAAPTDVGSYRVVYRVSGNYTLGGNTTESSADFSIVPCQLTVTTQSQSLTYNGKGRYPDYTVTDDAGQAKPMYRDVIKPRYFSEEDGQDGQDGQDKAPTDIGDYWVEYTLVDNLNYTLKDAEPTAFTIALGEGTVQLSAGRLYTLGSGGMWTVNGDAGGIRYPGGTRFYVPQDAEYTFTRVS